PPFTADESFLHALGRAGGICDCGDAEDEEASLGSEAAGWPFFGQFIAHDITADRSPPVPHVDPTRLRHARSPQINLECLYRYGHSQIRHKYTLNSDCAPMPIFPDLIGFRPVPAARRVDWMRFFDANGHPPAQRAKKIDGRLVGALIALPVSLTGECEVEAFH